MLENFYNALCITNKEWPIILISILLKIASIYMLVSAGTYAGNSEVISTIAYIIITGLIFVLYIGRIGDRAKGEATQRWTIYISRYIFLFIIITILGSGIIFLIKEGYYFLTVSLFNIKVTPSPSPIASYSFSALSAWSLISIILYALLSLTPILYAVILTRGKRLSIAGYFKELFSRIKKEYLFILLVTGIFSFTQIMLLNIKTISRSILSPHTSSMFSNLTLQQTREITSFVPFVIGLYVTFFLYSFFLLWHKKRYR